MQSTSLLTNSPSLPLRCRSSTDYATNPTATIPSPAPQEAAPSADLYSDSPLIRPPCGDPGHPCLLRPWTGVPLLYDSKRTEARAVSETAGEGGQEKAAAGGLGKTLELGMLFGLWYLFNIYFNIYNKQVIGFIFFHLILMHGNEVRSQWSRFCIRFLCLFTIALSNTYELAGDRTGACAPLRLHLPWSFHYPATITLAKFAVGSVLVILMWTFNLFKRPNINSSQFWDIVPLAVVHTLGNLFTNMSLGKVTVSFTHTIKAMEPFFSVLLSAFFLGEYPTRWFVGSLLPIVGGVALASMTEASFNWAGFWSAMASNLTNQSRNVFSKKVMVKKEESMDNVTLFSIITMMSFVLLFPVTLYLEGFKFSPAYHFCLFCPSYSSILYCVVMRLELAVAVFPIISYIILRLSENRLVLLIKLSSTRVTRVQSPQNNNICGLAMVELTRSLFFLRGGGRSKQEQQSVLLLFILSWLIGFGCFDVLIRSTENETI